MPMKNPPHPGDFIRTEIIDPAGLSVTAAAAALRVSRPALSSLLNRKAGLSGDMALRIEKDLWGEDGHDDADAGFVRDCPDQETRKTISRAAGSVHPNKPATHEVALVAAFRVAGPVNHLAESGTNAGA